MPDQTQTPPKPSGEVSRGEPKSKAPEDVDIKNKEALDAKRQKSLEEARKKVEEEKAKNVQEQQRKAMKGAQKAQAGRTEELLKASGTAVPDSETPQKEAVPPQVLAEETREPEKVKPAAKKPPETEKEGEKPWWRKIFSFGNREKPTEEKPKETSTKAVESGKPEEVEKLAADNAEEKPTQKAGQNPEDK